MLKIIAALRLLGANTTDVVKEGVEYIPKSAEHIETVERTVEAPTGVYPVMAIAVVLGPFLAVGQDLVRFVDLLELVFSAGSLVPIGMIFHGFLAKRPAYILFAVASCYSQRFVIVLRRHAISPAEVGSVRPCLNGNN